MQTARLVILIGLACLLVAAVFTGWPEAALTRLLVERELDGSTATVLEVVDLSSQPTLVVYRPTVVDGQPVGAYPVEVDAASIRAGRQSARAALASLLAALLIAFARVRRQPMPMPAVQPAPAPRRPVRQAPRGPPGPAARHALTARELEVLRLMATGAMTYREIANHLVVGEETVRTHAKNILHKLDQPDRRKAVLAAMAAGLI